MGNHHRRYDPHMNGRHRPGKLSLGSGRHTTLISFVVLAMFFGALLWYLLRRKRHGLQRIPPEATARSRTKIYTRTGDSGTSAFGDQKALPKSSSCFDAMGSLDELSANLGCAIEHSRDSSLPAEYLDQLREVQLRLQDVGSVVSDPGKKDPAVFSKQLGTDTVKLEVWMDSMEAFLEPLRAFILPSGGLAATSLHVCRAVCRRCERALTAYLGVGEGCDRFRVVPYVNRLSDYLFTLARLAAKNDGREDLIWKKEA